MIKIKRILLFILLISFVFFSCKDKATKDFSKSEEYQSYIKSITTYKYENIYDEAGLLKSSIRKLDGQFYFIDGSVSEYDLGGDKLIYTYDKGGRLTRCEIYDLDENSLSEIKVYGVNSEEIYILEDGDTLSYTKEIVNGQGDFLIREKKEKQGMVDNIILPPVHKRIEVIYDENNQRKSYVEYDLINSTSKKLFYEYHYQGDTLIGNVYDERNQHSETIKTIINEGFTRKQTYDIFGQLLETEDTYKDKSQVVLRAIANYEYNVIDSLFYNQERKEQKYISIFDGMYTSMTKTYNDKGDIIREEVVTIHENNPR